MTTDVKTDVNNGIKNQNDSKPVTLCTQDITKDSHVNKQPQKGCSDGWQYNCESAFTSGFTTKVGLLGLRVGSHLVHSLHSSDEPHEL